MIRRLFLACSLVALLAAPVAAQTQQTTTITPSPIAGLVNCSTVGAIVIGASPPRCILDVATGQVLTSGGVGVAPAWSANPTLTTLSLGGGSVGSLSAPANGVLQILQSNGTSAGRLLIGPNDASNNGNSLVNNGSDGALWITNGITNAFAPLRALSVQSTSYNLALNKAQPADQVARSSSGGTFVMMGLGAAVAPCTITPTSTGRVVFTISGDIVNNTTATTVTVKIAEGTGTAPANNASATGTVVSAAVLTGGLTGYLTVPFSITASVTGLATATAVWFDLQLTTSSTNTGQPTNVTCLAHEI